MEYLEATTALTQQLPGTHPTDAAVRAALEHAVQPWLRGVHSGATDMHWGLFATAVQAVTARWWAGPAELIVPAGAPTIDPQLAGATAQLTEAVATLFAQAAADPADPAAWDYAVAAEQLRDAARQLRQADRQPA